MTKDMLELLQKILPNYGERDAIEVIHVFDAASNKVYLQTRPYLKDGKVIVKRLGEVDVTIEKAYQIIEEYDVEAQYETE